MIIFARFVAILTFSFGLANPLPAQSNWLKRKSEAARRDLDQDPLQRLDGGFGQ